MTWQKYMSKKKPSLACLEPPSWFVRNHRTQGKTIIQTEGVNVRYQSFLLHLAGTLIAAPTASQFKTQNHGGL